MIARRDLLHLLQERITRFRMEKLFRTVKCRNCWFSKGQSELYEVNVVEYVSVVYVLCIDSNNERML